MVILPLAAWYHLYTRTTQTETKTSIKIGKHKVMKKNGPANNPLYVELVLCR